MPGRLSVRARAKRKVLRVLEVPKGRLEGGLPGSLRVRECWVAKK